MNRVFSIRTMFPIPDGTKVCPFLNPFDVNEKELPLETLSGMSIAAGELDPHTESSIHIHPLVAQITWVIEGQLKVKMKEQGQEQPYTLGLARQEAVLTAPRTFFQLMNPSQTAVTRVLYIVSPAYVFDADENGVQYDDAIVINATWEELARQDWKLRQLEDVPAIEEERKKAIARISKRKS
jgi:hypothetical protein